MNKRIKTGLLIFALLLSNIAWAEDIIETIQLNHQLPANIIQQIRAFMPEGTTARAYNNFIILKASPSEIAEIKNLINTLDTPLQRVKITVLNSEESLSDEALLQISTDIYISNRGGYGGVSVEGWSDRIRSNIHETYQAQGIAGNAMYISMGRSIPQQQRYLVFLPYGGVGVQTDNYYLDVNSGFQAVARIQANGNAVVDIHPVFSQFTGRHGAYEQSQIATQISGRVGEWIELGRIDNEINVENHGSTRYHSDYQKQQTVYLRIDTLN